MKKQPSTTKRILRTRGPTTSLNEDEASSPLSSPADHSESSEQPSAQRSEAERVEETKVESLEGGDEEVEYVDSAGFKGAKKRKGENIGKQGGKKTKPPSKGKSVAAKKSKGLVKEPVDSTSTPSSVVGKQESGHVSVSVKDSSSNVTVGSKPFNIPSPLLSSFLLTLPSSLIAMRTEGGGAIDLQVNSQTAIEHSIGRLPTHIHRTALCIAMNRFSAFCSSIDVPCFPITAQKTATFISRALPTHVGAQIRAAIPSPLAFPLPIIGGSDGVAPDESEPPEVTRDLVGSWTEALAYAQGSTTEVWESTLPGGAPKNLMGDPLIVEMLQAFEASEVAMGSDQLHSRASSVAMKREISRPPVLRKLPHVSTFSPTTGQSFDDQRTATNGLESITSYANSWTPEIVSDRKVSDVNVSPAYTRPAALPHQISATSSLPVPSQLTTRARQTASPFGSSLTSSTIATPPIPLRLSPLLVNLANPSSSPSDYRGNIGRELQTRGNAERSEAVVEVESGRASREEARAPVDIFDSSTYHPSHQIPSQRDPLLESSAFDAQYHRRFSHPLPSHGSMFNHPPVTPVASTSLRASFAQTNLNAESAPSSFHSQHYPAASTSSSIAPNSSLANESYFFGLSPSRPSVIDTPTVPVTAPMRFGASNYSPTEYYHRMSLPRHYPDTQYGVSHAQHNWGSNRLGEFSSYSPPSASLNRYNDQQMQQQQAYPTPISQLDYDDRYAYTPVSNEDSNSFANQMREAEKRFAMSTSSNAMSGEHGGLVGLGISNLGGGGGGGGGHMSQLLHFQNHPGQSTSSGNYENTRNEWDHTGASASEEMARYLSGGNR